MNPRFFTYLIALVVMFTSGLAQAECRKWIDGYTKKNGTQVKGHWRTCPDGDKNNNYGAAEHEGQNPRKRDADQDGLPNYVDRDDNNNGLSDNADHELGKIFRSDDLRTVIIPQHKNYRKYDGFPIVIETLPPVIIYLPGVARTTNYQWTSSASCYEFTPNGVAIQKVDNDICRKVHGSKFEWTSSASCYEFTPNGVAIQKVDENICRAYVGRNFQWTSSASCYEFTPNGVAIQKVDTDICREVHGSKFEWTSSGSCYEFTPNGVAIQKVNTDVCRYDSADVLSSRDYSRKSSSGAEVMIDLIDLLATSAR